MKKLLSLLLAFCLLLSIAGCTLPEAAMQTVESVTQEGTTEPLFWPPIPTGTEETEAPTGFTHDPQPSQNDDHPVYFRPDDDRPEETYDPWYDSGQTAPTEATQESYNGLDPNGTYDSKWDVALFLVTYGRLPNNYITKSRAQQLGWSSGSVEKYAPGKCIGGDRFYNNEGHLPDGYTYYECDIGTLGRGSRGAQRLVYTKTGIVYYTSDHYETFTKLYG